MASSVASERAFSSAGITISKRRNRLDGDIVEALQCLKSLKSHDLMSRVFPSVADEEVLLDEADSQAINQEGTTHEIVDAEWSFEGVVEDAGDDDEDN
jgi:hAT family C-terminal dimerisation region